MTKQSKPVRIVKYDSRTSYDYWEAETLVLVDEQGRTTSQGFGVAAVGDSLTANFSDGGNDMGVFSLPDHYLQGLVSNDSNPPVRRLMAHGGYPIQQILAECVPVILGLNPRPAACIVLAGTNNINDGPGLALSRIVKIYDALEAGGVRPVIATIPPYPGNHSFSNEFNQGLRRVAQKRGYDLIDFHAALVNPVTGGFKPGYAMTDNLHPSYRGVKAMAQKVEDWAALCNLPKMTAPIAMSSEDYSNQLGGPVGMFIADSNGDGIADSFDSYGGPGPVFSIHTDSDGIPWQRITQPSTSINNALLQFNDWTFSAVGPGDIIELSGRIRTGGFDAAFIPPTDGSQGGGRGPGWSFSVGFNPSYSGIGIGRHTDMDGIFYARQIAPATVNGGIKLNLQTVDGPPASGSVWVEYAQVSVRNLTQLAAERRVFDIHITSGSNTITSDGGASFTSADIGKPVHLFGAGPGSSVVVTTITGVTDANTATVGVTSQNDAAYRKLVIRPGAGL